MHATCRLTVGCGRPSPTSLPARGGTIGSMPESPPTGVWVEERVTVGRSSIEGHGLFAAHDIPEGTTVVRLTSVVGLSTQSSWPT